jgi:hypothetical protein
MNIISGNCAGTFSGFLAHLSWMETAEKSNGEINLTLHARNKTHYPGNSYSNYRWLNSTDINNFEEILEENLLLKFFEKNEYLKDEFPKDCIYFETYPEDFKSNLKNYPKDTLKYEGRGGLRDQYDDIESLTLTRNALNNQLNKFKFTEEFDNLIKEEEKLIKNKKVLTLMIRCSNHYPGISSEDIIKSSIESVKEIIDDYDALFVVTIVKPFLDKFVELFPNKCIYTNRERFDDIDWKGGRDVVMTDEEYQIEYQNAFLDVILASKTDMIIGSSSNMFLASLCMNPQIPFKIFCNSNGS